MPLFHFIQDLGEQAEAADAADDAVHPGEARTMAVGQETPAISNLPAPVHIGQNEREGLPGTLSEWGPLVPIWEAKQGDGSEQPVLLLLLTPKQVLSLGKLVDDPGLIIFP